MTRRLEDQVQRAVCEHLMWRSTSHMYWCHIPNGGFRTPAEAAIFKSLGVKPGAPDLLLIHGGHPFALELKSEDGKLTPAQRTAHVLMSNAGATVATAFGVDQAVAQLKEWGLIK